MPLATVDHVFRTHQKSSRHGSKVRALQLHHATSTSWRSVVNMMVSGSREVSSNDVVGANGELIEVVERGARAWTSGSATFDAQAHTFEICNAILGDATGWPVSDAAQETVANRCADIAFENGFTIERSTTNFSLYGHGEMYPKWGLSYPTACPGGLNLDWIFTTAERRRQQLAAGTPHPLTQARHLLEELMVLVSRVEDGAIYLVTSTGASHIQDMDTVYAIQSLLQQCGMKSDPIRLYASQITLISEQARESSNINPLRADVTKLLAN